MYTNLKVTKEPWELYNFAYIYGGSGPPGFDYPAILREMIGSSDNKGSIQAIITFFLMVLYEVNAHPEKVIEPLFPAAQKNKYKNSDGEYEWCIKKQNDSVTGLRQVEWGRKSGHEHGYCIFSLVKQMKPGCTDIEVFFIVAKILFGSDWLKQKMQHYQGASTLPFLSDSVSYNREESILADKILKVIDQIAGERKVYTFKTDEGNPSFYLLRWRYNNQNIELYRTLQKDSKTGDIAWELIAASPGDLVYNKRLLKKFKDSDVHIHDNIANSDHSDIPGVVNIWIGDLSALDSIKPLLKGRKTSYLFNPDNPESVGLGHNMIQKFQELKLELNLCECRRRYLPRIIRRRKGHQSSADFDVNELAPLFKLGLDLVSKEQFYDDARNNHGLALQPEVDEDDGPRSISFERLDAINPELDFMGKPFYRIKTIAVAIAEKGVGKSLFAMANAFMISSGGVMGQMLSAKKQYETYYLDAEMIEGDIEYRIKTMIGNFSDQHAIRNNFKYDCLRALNKKLDLTKPKDQKWVKERIGDAKFIVFDNLGKLVPPKALYNDDLWAVAFDFFRSLADEGRSILIVHHKNKKGEHKGVGQIVNDADVVLDLTKPGYCTNEETIMEISSNKGRAIYGSHRKTLKLEFYNEDNLIKYRIEAQDGESGESMPDSLLTEEEAQRYPIRAAIIRLLKEKRDSGIDLEKAFVQSRDIREQLPKGMCKQTFTNHFNALIEANRIERIGKDKYYLYPAPASLKTSEKGKD